MTQQHTKGPWVATDNYDGTKTIGFIQEDWRDHDGAPEITVAENVPDEYARLIAAAPDLLDALRHAHALLIAKDAYAGPGGREAFDQHAAAIAKATGGANG